MKIKLCYDEKNCKASYKPDSVIDKSIVSHSSGIVIANNLKQPTQMAIKKHICIATSHFYLVLLPIGFFQFYIAIKKCELLPHIFTLALY